MRKIILILTVICSTIFAKAQEIDIIDIVAKQLDIKAENIAHDLVAQKKIPYDSFKTIVVIPEITEQEEDYYYVYNSHVLVVDTKTGRIIHRYFEPSNKGGWVSDAIVLSEIIIDTAPYQLSTTDRAFGLRVRYNGSSKVNPYRETTLSLFVQEQNRLKKVLNRYPVKSFLGEWNMRCSGEFDEEEKILIIQSKRTNGYANILVKSTLSNIISSEDENEECVEEKTITKQREILVFNGKAYDNN